MGSEKDKPEMSKTRIINKVVPDIAPNIVTEDRENHQRLRRALSHGFSDGSIKAQEPIITKYVEQLIQGLRKHCVDEQGHTKSLNVSHPKLLERAYLPIYRMLQILLDFPISRSSSSH